MHFRLLSAIRKLLWRQMHSQAPKLKTKTKWLTVFLALSNQNDVEQQKENEKTLKYFKIYTDLIKSLEKMADWIKSQRKTQRGRAQTTWQSLKQLDMLYCWEYYKQKIIWTCLPVHFLIMVAHDVLKFSNCTRFTLVQFWEHSKQHSRP